jgi:hypothetical protein
VRKGNNETTGAHSPNCDYFDEEKDKPEEPYVTCGEPLKGGGTCDFLRQPSQECSNYLNHAKTHTNNGGSGGGNLDDI